MTDADLTNWMERDTDLNDDLHMHFEEWGRWDWCEIADEGKRVYSLMFGEIEDGSPIDGLLSAVAAHANHMAYEAIAAALGVDADNLRITVAEWGENQDNLPPPVSAEKLLEMVEATKREFEARFKK